MNTEERLSGAIVASVASGRTIPCGRWGERDLWTSESAADRARAAVLCTGCPRVVRDACQALANATKATAGVWGGVDYTERRGQTWRTTNYHRPDAQGVRRNTKEKQ